MESVDKPNNSLNIRDCGHINPCFAPKRVRKSWMQRPFTKGILRCPQRKPEAWSPILGNLRQCTSTCPTCIAKRTAASSTWLRSLLWPRWSALSVFVDVVLYLSVSACVLVFALVLSTHNFAVTKALCDRLHKPQYQRGCTFACTSASKLVSCTLAWRHAGRARTGHSLFLACADWGLKVSSFTFIFGTSAGRVFWLCMYSICWKIALKPWMPVNSHSMRDREDMMGVMGRLMASCVRGVAREEASYKVAVKYRLGQHLFWERVGWGPLPIV